MEQNRGESSIVSKTKKKNRGDFVWQTISLPQPFCFQFAPSVVNTE
jgi:hypothetical protein